MARARGMPADGGKRRRGWMNSGAKKKESKAWKRRKTGKGRRGLGASNADRHPAANKGLGRHRRFQRQSRRKSG